MLNHDGFDVYLVLDLFQSRFSGSIFGFQSLPEIEFSRVKCNIYTEASSGHGGHSGVTFSYR